MDEGAEGLRPKCIQRLVEVSELSRPRVRVDEVELGRLRLLEKRGAVGRMKDDARVVPEMAVGDRLNRRIGVDGLEPGARIHPVQQPGRADARASAQFEEAAVGF